MNATLEPRTAEDGDVNDLELGVVCEMLLSRRRRLMLDYLDENPEATFSELVEYVTREEVGLGYGTKERKRVYVALYQNHAPKLDDAGIIEYEGTGDETPIRQGRHFRQVMDALDRLRDEAEEQSEQEETPRPRFRTLRTLLTGTDEEENVDDDSGDG